jgi:MarR family transcriptional regulator, 2-MHQ and catechol-resistance regulon repressor
VKIEEEIKQSKFQSSSQKAYLNIIFTANWIQANAREVLKPYGLTLQQYNVLRILRGRFPKCAYPNEIKAVMLDKNPDLTRLCDRMISNGWIIREIDGDNRRKMKISITQSGMDLLSSLDTIINQLQEKYMNLSDHDNFKLSDLLDNFRG